MAAMRASPSMEAWLADVRVYVKENAPDVMPVLDVYLGEARFGRQYIAADLMLLGEGAALLEIGAGSLLLSCQLVREGYRVTALEPIGSGYTHLERLRELVVHKASSSGCLPRMLNQPAETFSERGCFDYAFSINVMEHVGDVALTLANVCASLKPGAVYRFTCPNYLFPYEPHFNIPTLFSKRLTEKLLGSRILLNEEIPDPKGTWDSLNWIDVIQISRIVKRLPGLSVTFGRHLLVSTFKRIAFDRNFAMRRSNLVRIGIVVLVKLRLHHLAAFIPAMFQPIIDCAVTRTGVQAAS